MTIPQGTGANAKDILKRIDYLGSGSLLVAVSSITVFPMYLFTVFQIAGRIHARVS